MKTWTIDSTRNVTLTSYLWDDPALAANQGRWYPDPRPAILICPGGGYAYVGKREGYPVALHFKTRGYQAFVLNYSVKDDSEYPNPWVDASRALRFIRHNADAFGIDPTRISIIGFSAGGHVAAWLASSFDDPELMQCERDHVAANAFYDDEAAVIDSVSNRPDNVVLGYAMTNTDMSTDTLSAEEVYALIRKELSFIPGKIIVDQDPRTALVPRVTSRHPRTFVWTTATDRIVPPAHSLDYARALVSANVEVECHMFASGMHGLATADRLTCSDGRDVPGNVPLWIDLAHDFLDAQPR